jgi:hypothetical protein
MNVTTVYCTNSTFKVGPELGVVIDLVGDAITVFRKVNICCIEWGGSEYI